MIGNTFKLNPPERFKNLPATPGDPLPALWTTFFAVVFPLILMIAKTINTMLMASQRVRALEIEQRSERCGRLRRQYVARRNFAADDQ